MIIHKYQIFLSLILCFLQIHAYTRDSVTVYVNEIRNTYNDEIPFSEIQSIPEKDYYESEYTYRPRMEKTISLD